MMIKQTQHSNLIEVIYENDENITIFFREINFTTKINVKNNLMNRSFVLVENYSSDDQILCKLELHNSHIYIYVLNQTVYWINYSIEEKNQPSNAFEISIERYSDFISIEKKGFADIVVDIPSIGIHAEFEGLLFPKNSIVSIDCELPIDTKSKRVLLGKAKCGIHELVAMYFPMVKKVKLIKYKFKILTCQNELSIKTQHYKSIVIHTKFNEKIEAELTDTENKIASLDFFKNINNITNENILAIFSINRTKYYVYLKQTGIYLSNQSPDEITKFHNHFKVISFGKHIYIFGRMAHQAYRSFGKYDYLYVGNAKKQIAKFKRPFRNIQFLRQFGFFKIKASDLDFNQSIHYSLYLGTKNYPLHQFPLQKNKKPLKIYRIHKNDNKIIAVRTNVNNKATYSIVPFIPMYSFSNRIKIKLAKFISDIFYKNKKYNVNLYFEKQASKADESGFRVFEKVKTLNNIKSKNFFILDKNVSNFKELKKKYGKDLIRRFSFRHYLALFNSDYFISSELSNHVINDRIFNNAILEKIKEVPLIFLQHGIMFAKPVENPMVKSFYKNNTVYNIYKNVVNSKLEAKEFYKMGYDDSDLLYTGLATFDYAHLDKTSDKIVFMPTYRFWEEGMIYSGNIDKTTYHKSILKVIHAFEKAGLLDKLIIVPHNKFAEYIYKGMPEYKHMIDTNPSNALKIGRIFITDFSSAIYDAIYRGAYPIFYWEDKNYLITKYQAVPPVNEENAPGPIAANTDELIKLVKKAIEKNYELEDEYKAKYKKINEFSDNQNTNRIIDFLLQDNIL